MRSRLLSALALAGVASLALSACAAGGAPAAPQGKPAVDGTFTLALNADPGTLNPLLTANTPTHAMAQIAYDYLVYVDPETAKVGPWLAEKWKETPSSVSYTIRDGITCADGSPLTAQTVADNIAFVTDEKNGSALRGVYVPADATASVDGQTVTISTPKPSPFLLMNTSRLPILCEAGLKDPDAAAKGSTGSGPFTLSESVPNDHYTFTRRADYSWGPDDTTAKTAGLPKTVVVKIITNESTAANQLLAGEVSAATIEGDDQARLDSAGLTTVSRSRIAGEMYFNHGTVTGDKAVRTALVQALNLADLAKVITGGRGGPATGLVTTDPRACVDDTVSGNLPSFDTAAAAAALDKAGWTLGSDGIRHKDGTPLTVRFFYDSLGDTYDAAADLAQQAWTKLGAKVEMTSGDGNKAVEALLSGKNNSGWDVAWEPLYVNLPSMLTPFFSGPAPAKGLNFSQIDNPDYDAAVAKATNEVGAASCATWAQAEKALFAQTDVVPFANAVAKTYFSHAGLAFGNTFVGSALRVFE
ncbi:ABC transporter substrate-binding protein [Microbacterium luticocti]|uniref:ABC transporter substrate-binding protein n=1 Tax=Microbacterium luticocti TaxID=451764 RepID=UPI0004029A77|nr:ABC transporter substrate-binding protein [Microbacterium luticocti]